MSSKISKSKINLKKLHIVSDEFLNLQKVAIELCKLFTQDSNSLRPQVVDDGWELNRNAETGIWTHPEVPEIEFHTRKIVQYARINKLDAFDVSGTYNIKLTSNTDFSEVTFLGKQIIDVLADNKNMAVDCLSSNNNKHMATRNTKQSQNKKSANVSTSTKNTNKYLEALADKSEYLIKRYRTASKTQHLKKVDAVKAFIKVEIEREYNHSCSSSELEVLKNILQSAFPADINSRSDR